MNILHIIITLLLQIFGASGVYFADFDYIVCNDLATCIHEQGHQLDFYLGEPSQTEEFKESIKAFPLLLENNSCIIKTESCNYYEAYAMLWEAVEGDINNLPPDYKEFYTEAQW